MTLLRPRGQMSESLAMAVLLTLAGGFQDAYSYNCRGGVFANAQTGNIVLLGQNLAQGNFQDALHYVLPLAAFLCGVYVTEWVHDRYRDSGKLHWRQFVLIVESFMLAAVGFLPHSMDVSANVLMSFACAMQVNSFRKFCGLPCATTMCIGNIRSGAELMSKYHITRKKELKKKGMLYFGVIMIFAAGAALGAVMSIHTGRTVIWMAALLLLLGFLLMFIKEEQKETEGSSGT